MIFLTFLSSPSASRAGDAQDALQNAASLVQQGRLDEADQQAKLALADPRTRPAACSVLGTIRFQQKQLPDSAKFFQEAIRLEPRLVGAHLGLAQVYSLQGKSEAALRTFQRVLALDPSNFAARLALARSETEKGNFERSLSLAEPVLESFKRSPDGLFVLAGDYVKTGNPSAAAGLAKDWGRLPEAPPTGALIEFALLLAKGGVVREAIELLEQAKATAPSYELAFYLGGLYLLNKNEVGALENYDAALNFNPGAVAALRQAADVAEHRGELERALSYWIRAKKIEPDNPEILLGFGRVCLKMDLLDDAEPALTKAEQLRPKEIPYQYTLAAAKLGKKQFQASQTLLEQILAKKPGDSQVQYALGAVLYLGGRLSEAAEHLRRSIALQPEQAASYYYLALVTRDAGNESEAIGILEELLKHYPDHASGCEVLGSLLMNARRYSEAETRLGNAVRLNPKSVKANYQLGLLLVRMGKKEEADKQLEVANSLRAEDEANSRLQLRLLDPGQ